MRFVYVFIYFSYPKSDVSPGMNVNTRVQTSSPGLRTHP